MALEIKLCNQFYLARLSAGCVMGTLYQTLPPRASCAWQTRKSPPRSGPGRPMPEWRPRDDHYTGSHHSAGMGSFECLAEKCVLAFGAAAG